MKKYPETKVVGHPLAPKSGYLGRHRIVLYEKLGPGIHPCHWCEKPLEWTIGKKTKGNALLVDHIDSDTQNLSPENLVASCNACNVSRGRDQTIKHGEDFIESDDGVRMRATRMICTVCKEEFLMVTSQLKYRKGRFCSRACRNKGVARESGVGIQEGELFIEVEEGGRTKRLRAVEVRCKGCDTIMRIEARRARANGNFCGNPCAAAYRERMKKQR